MYLINSVQTDYKEFVDNQVEEIYLEVIIQYVSTSSRVICLDVFFWFAIDLAIRLLLPSVCMPQT